MSSQPTYYATAALPINMSSKTSYYAPSHGAYRTTSVSPPEVADSSTTSGLSSAVPSYSNSATSSSYAGSASEYDSASSSGGTGVDLMDLLSDRLTGSFDPLPLDRSLATQAQTSGALNAKHREILALQAEAQRRLASTRSNFADGMKAAKEVKRDLDWTQKRVTSLKSKAQKKYPVEYGMARDSYPAPIDC